jgi:hypothetical protein
MTEADELRRVLNEMLATPATDLLKLHALYRELGRVLRVPR